MTIRPTTRLLAEVAVGDTLDPLDIPLTRTLIVSTAIASRDYQDVHHDPELARRRGSPDIFMNILSTNGLVGRFVTDWAGPGAVLQAVAIRLGAPNYPGDTMHLTGEVTAVGEAGPDGRGTVTLSVRGANRIGDHVTGTVELSLPAAPPSAGPPGEAAPGGTASGADGTAGRGAAGSAGAAR